MKYPHYRCKEYYLPIEMDGKGTYAYSYGRGYMEFNIWAKEGQVYYGHTNMINLIVEYDDAVCEVQA